MTITQLSTLFAVVIIIIGLFLIIDATRKFFKSKKKESEETKDIENSASDSVDRALKTDLSDDIDELAFNTNVADDTFDELSDGFNHEYNLPPVAINASSVEQDSEDTIQLSNDMIVSDDVTEFNHDVLYNSHTENDDTDINIIAQDELLVNAQSDAPPHDNLNSSLDIDNNNIGIDREVDINDDTNSLDINIHNSVVNDHVDDDFITSDMDDDITDDIIDHAPKIHYAVGGRSAMVATEEESALDTLLEHHEDDITHEITHGIVDIDTNDDKTTDDTLSNELNNEQETDLVVVDIETDTDDAIIVDDTNDHEDLVSSIPEDLALSTALASTTNNNDDIATPHVTNEVFVQPNTLEEEMPADLNLNTYDEASPLLDEHLQLSDDQDQNSPLTNAKDNINISILPNNEFSYISGAKLLELVDSFGFKFGAMNMFHRYQNKDGNGLLWFSMMGLTKDGIVPFDLNTLPTTMELKGLVLFLPLPHPKVLQGFDSMLSIAGLISREVDGFIVDDEGNEMSIEYKKKTRAVLQNTFAGK